MAPSAAAVRNRDAAESEPVVNLAPPAKRLRFASPVDDRDASDDDDGGEIPHHPLRIKPSGNALTASYNLRDTSTGIFAMLPDELLMQILGLLDAQSLVNLGGTSKGMYGFCRAEELWRPLVTEYVFISLIFNFRSCHSIHLLRTCIKNRDVRRVTNSNRGAQILCFCGVS